MRHLFRHISYRMRISLVITLFALIPLTLFGSYFIKSEWNSWQKSVTEQYSQMIEVSSEQLNREVQAMQSKLVYVSNNYSIRIALSSMREMNLVDGLEFVSLLRDTVDSITVGDSYLEVRWFAYQSKNYGGYIHTFQELEEELKEDDASYEEIMRINAGQVFQVVRDSDSRYAGMDSSSKRLFLYTRITSLKGPDFLLEMSLPIEKMIQMQKNDLPYGCICGMNLELDDGQQMILFFDETEDARQLLETYHSRGSCPGYYPIVRTVNSLSNSRIVCLISKEYIMEQISGNIARYVFFVLLFLTAVVICSYIASALLTRRVMDFIEKMSGELDAILDGNDEIQLLWEKSELELKEGDSDIQKIEKRIRKLVQKMQEYYERLEKTESEKSCLELEILQMRINPHFLYNTLTSIRYQIKESRIRRSIDSLIHYYRIVLSKGHLWIKIEEEMLMIQEYLELQIFAYRLENIKYEFEVDEQVKSSKIIKHLLQPIVENALEHGVRSNRDEGMLMIRARQEGEDVVFEIEDNGVGMSQSQISCALKEPDVGSEGGGYGIYNVQQRIENYYGKGYGIQFQSKEGAGTCVTIRIARREE